MAIVFISAKNKQGAFFWGIIMLLVLFLAVVSLIVFLPDFLNTPPKIPKEVTFVSPNTSVDLGVLDSDKIKNLELFTPVEIAFTYVVSDARGKKITGNIFVALDFRGRLRRLRRFYAVRVNGALPQKCDAGMLSLQLQNFLLKHF